MVPLSHQNGQKGQQDNDLQKPLHVLIVGAGIGGLAAALMLRNRGHEVTILEKSGFSSETGAAIIVNRNFQNILRRFGLNPGDYGGVSWDILYMRNEHGEVEWRRDERDPEMKLWQYPAQLIHRVALHQALREKALDPKGNGRVPNLELSCPITEVDTDAGIVTAGDGRKFQGDVVVGADGVHSKCRYSFLDKSITPYNTGKNSFRFLVPREELKADPRTEGLFEPLNTSYACHGEDRRVVVYPCDWNETINGVAIHPSKLSDAGGDWNTSSDKSLMEDIYKDFDPVLRAILSHVPEGDLKIWPFFDMPKAPTWIKGRLAMMGDAVHPFTPYLAAGAAMAIEDAACLTVLLEPGLDPSEIPSRMKLYEDIRYDRANKILDYTRAAGKDRSQADPQAFGPDKFQYITRHDEWNNSMQKLREHKWRKLEESTRKPLPWSMPVGFGPVPSSALSPTNPPPETTYSITFRTDLTLLQNMLPPGALADKSMKFNAFGAVTSATLAFTRGSSPRGSSLAFYLEDMTYNAQVLGHEAGPLRGRYQVLQFNDSPDELVAQREAGVPAMHCDLDVKHDCSGGKGEDGVKIEGRWRGAKVFDMEIGGFADGGSTAGPLVNGHVNGDSAPDQALRKEVQASSASDYVFSHTHGSSPWAKADPADRFPVVVRGERREGEGKETKAEKAEFAFDGSASRERLPTLWHVVQRMAELPVYATEKACCRSSGGK